jgi:phenylpropionate dioxygenase-like ring-hydroxylating dioxygenase large terminal subunit
MTATSVLRHYWYPVALGSELTDQPLACRVLGEPVVVYRVGQQVAALRDLCIHRGSPLSLGWVEGETVVCAYHGWQYAADGTCVRIPSLPPERPIPRKARLPTYRAAERYGLVWVCLDEPHAPIPAYPEAEDPRYRTVWTQYYWRANAARVVENVMDFAHFPWVHPGILGHRERPVYAPISVATSEEGISYVLDDQATDATRAYRVTLPFTLHMRVQRRTEDPNRVLENALFFPGCPVTERETKHYFGYARDYNLDPSYDEPFITGSIGIVDQDQRIVESQRPEELPLDLAAELHLRGPDAASVAYRRALGALGVHW